MDHVLHSHGSRLFDVVFLLAHVILGSVSRFYHQFLILATRNEATTRGYVLKSKHLNGLGWEFSEICVCSEYDVWPVGNPCTLTMEKKKVCTIIIAYPGEHQHFPVF